MEEGREGFSAMCWGKGVRIRGMMAIRLSAPLPPGTLGQWEPFSSPLPNSVCFEELF